jgi:hypothetical protein
MRRSESGHAPVVDVIASAIDDVRAPHAMTGVGRPNLIRIRPWCCVAAKRVCLAHARASHAIGDRRAPHPVVAWEEHVARLHACVRGRGGAPVGTSVNTEAAHVRHREGVRHQHHREQRTPEEHGRLVGQRHLCARRHPRRSDPRASSHALDVVACSGATWRGVESEEAGETILVGWAIS